MSLNAAAHDLGLRVREGSICTVDERRPSRARGHGAPDEVPNVHLPYPKVEAWATCWCERTTVMVTLDDVLNGRTASCGRPNCKEH